MKKVASIKRLTSLAAISLLAFGTIKDANAVTLYEAVVAALENDPQFLASRQAFRATSLEEKIALSDLLPQISYFRSQGEARYDRGIVGSPLPSQKVQTKTLSEGLTITQQIFNRELTSNYEIGSLRKDQATQQFRVDTLQTYLAVAEQYFKVLKALQDRQLATSELEFVIELNRLAEKGVEAGEMSQLDVLSALADEDLARARVLESEQLLQVAITSLEARVGMEIKAVQPMDSYVWKNEAEIPSLKVLENDAAVYNPNIRVAALEAELGKAVIKRTEAGHYPVIDVVHSRSKSESDSVNTLNTENDIVSTTVRMSIPIFSGNKVSYAVEQASARTAQAEAALRQIQQEVLLKLKDDYFRSKSAIQNIEAYERAVFSAKQKLNATTVGLEAGVNVYGDVLKAKRDLATVLSDLHRVQLDAAIARFSMLALSGRMNLASLKTLSDQNLIEISLDDLNAVGSGLFKLKSAQEVLSIEVDSESENIIYSLPIEDKNK